MNLISQKGMIDPKEQIITLVDIHAFCLMPNHYHFLLSPRTEKGISRFMHRLNISYAKYFNTKYKRTGALFETRYRRVNISNQSQLLYVPYYIHLNPLKLASCDINDTSEEKEDKLSKFLESYPWSSHQEYAGKDKFTSLIHKDFLLELFGGEKHYLEEVKRLINKRATS